MYVVLGASGNIGSGVVSALKASGDAIVALVHSAEKARRIEGGSVEALVVDVLQTAALHDALKRGSRAFLLNPPADPRTDTNVEELKTARSIAAAVKGAGLEKVVVASTYGAQKGDGIGDLSVLYEFERLVEATGVPTAINRGAYYFTNLEIPPATDGEINLPTPFPPDLKIPMVSPEDLGKAAAERLMSSIDDVGVRHIEGPKAYTFSDVAAAFSSALGKPVHVQRIPRDKIEESFRLQGFSKEAARAYTRMTEVGIDGGFEAPDQPLRGTITLEDYIDTLRQRGSRSP